ncbi:DUF302 domain-containing protein [Aliiroseovarius sp. S1339]|uniref:DUF302 domain-containing protein n=1 Tax=Aliiroseovarius sp. S1339 TaxID=2936990 RepID=UPI0020BFA383|nr:DUF302 domain-containing protein [Aliiroseovarius sp. S1339]MCK8462302.1 DUF302 domain-containing protein [Aliiroseovarius sp. S1339]
MRHSRILASLAGLAMMTQAATAEMVEKASPHSVPVTIDRLQAAVEGAGATVFARVDHAKGAASIDTELRPTEMLMFGNPALGTPAMLDSQTAGLDLPLRVLAYADGDGQVHVVYHAPASLVEDHGLPADAEYIAKMTGALDKLTDKAIAAE